MKPSKVENILNYNAPLEETKTILPLTCYQPFQSSFEPEVAVPPRQDPFLVNRWGGPATERPPHLSGRGFGTFPSTSPPTISTSAWGDWERRSLCNSTWRGVAPVAPRPPFPSMKEPQSPSARAVGGLGAHSQFPPKHEVIFRAVRNSRPDSGPSVRTESCPGPVQKHDRNRYYPLMLSPLERNINQSMSKAVPAGYNRPMVCNFCKNNKEVPDIYLNHYLYDPETKVLSCPVLRKHVCEICGGTGDQAHTLQYCPVNRERGLQAKVPVLLKTRTITNSTGKIRRN